MNEPIEYQVILEDEELLTEKQLQQSENIAKNMDLKNEEKIIEFGINAQKNLSTFSQEMLNHVLTKKTETIDRHLNDLMKKLEHIGLENLNQRKNIFLKIFIRTKGSLNEVLSKYRKAEAEINKLSVRLKCSKETLVGDTEILHEMIQQSQEYFNTLNIYIKAVDIKLNEVQTSPNYHSQFKEALEKRLYDLNISKEIAKQSISQSHMLQQMNQTLIHNIQTSILTTIPIWKNQMAAAVAFYQQKQNNETKRHLSKHTDMLTKTGSPVSSVDTLQKTHENLLMNVNNAIQLQRDRQKLTDELINSDVN